MRTQEEILQRMKTIEEDDVFGFGRDVLLPALDFEHARPYLRDNATPDAWMKIQTKDDEMVRKEAVNYLVFAWGKAQDHRGISAGRSIQKMTEFCWLLGLDIAKIEAAPYPQYGCPQLKVVAGLLGQPLPTDPDLLRMMEGEPCTPTCGSCGT